MIEIDYYKSIKIWFSGNVCRKLDGIVKLERCRDVIKVYCEDGKVHIVNWRAMSMIEEL